MRWSALCLPATDDARSPTEPARQALAIWALQFTPRVSVLDEAVLMEVEASLRLFGGGPALRARVAAEAPALGVVRLGWAPNGLAALALARAGIEDGLDGPLPARLDPLPLDVLGALRPHRLTLAHIGCRCLGDVRALPRGGLVRRFDRALLHALDQLYGQAPEVHTWVGLPERFEQRLELMARVEQAQALMVGAQRLLLTLGGWLAARQAGVTAFALRWVHDALRARAAGEGGELVVRTAIPTRDTTHLARLLAEHLARVTLQAPVGELCLRALEVQPLVTASASLLPPDGTQGTAGEEGLTQVLERLSVRLGATRVLRPVLLDDHRPEAQCRWQPATEALPRQVLPVASGPQPGFLLPQPLRLAMRGDRPLFQGELQLLLGPQRIEGGWWDRDESVGVHRNVVRDYWVAQSAQAGVLWVFQTRLEQAPAWFLHGYFA
ncbi:MAG: DNA polymerase Y family protein [Hydrogenophaga sp.]|jgi:protein ImuB|nr:DNA polymerase Y family protein [Hydrogenophaga sp.]